jgi:penicillin-binding protein-related factor A (putative recombinase)
MALPSDFLVVDDGHTFFAEVKSSHDEVSFNLNNVETMQWTAAIRSSAAAGSYFFFIRSEHLGLWFKVPASVMIEQRKTKKSIKWTELQPYFWKPKAHGY